MNAPGQEPIPSPGPLDTELPEGSGVAVRTAVTWGDCDPAGVVFYPAILGWMDRAAHALFREIGITREDEMPPGSMSFPVVEVGARFSAPALPDDAILVRVHVADVGRTSFRLAYDIRRLEDMELIATGWEQRVRVRLESLGRFAAIALDGTHRSALMAHMPEAGAGDAVLTDAYGSRDQG